MRFGVAVFVAVPCLGGLLGMLGFALFAVVFADPSRPVGELVAQGLRDGSFFGLVWAPGLSVVLAVRRYAESRGRPSAGRPA